MGRAQGKIRPVAARNRSYTIGTDNLQKRGVNANEEFDREDGITDELTPSKLAVIFKEAEDGSLFRLYQVYRKIIAFDTRIGGIVNKRKKAPARLGWEIEVNGDNPRAIEAAELIENLIKDINPSNLIKTLADGVMYGTKFLLNKYGSFDGYVLPYKNETISYTRVEMNLADQVPSEKIGSIVLTNGVRYYSARKLEEKGLVVSCVPEIDDSHYDLTGVLRPVPKMFVIKYYGLKNWVQYSEVHGYPTSVVTVPRNQYELYKNEIGRFLNSVGRKKYGVLLDKWEYKIHSDSLNSSEIFKDLLSFVNTETEIAILGQSATTQMSSGGYSAVTTYKEDEVDNIIDDSEVISESINRGIVKPILDLNFSDLSLKDVFFRIKTPKKKNFADIIKKYEMASRMGLKVSKSQLENELDLKIMKEDGDDAIELSFDKKEFDSAQDPERRKDTRTDNNPIADK